MRNSVTGFAVDIRPLFREEDVDAMQPFFDLTSYDEVRDNATAIFDRLSEGTMPCDEAWPAERIDLFQEWMDQGFPE
jgi:hypothetical protein